MATTTPLLGIIGGSGLYRMDGLQDATSVEIDTGHSRGLSDLLKLVGLGK